MSSARLTLVSHHLCPYVQRAAVDLTEKGVVFERISIDLAAKPDWFTAISPLGKVSTTPICSSSPPKQLPEKRAAVLRQEAATKQGAKQALIGRPTRGCVGSARRMAA